MQLNNVTIAAAGSRKTTSIVKEALEDLKKRVLIVTYTLDNIEQIKSYIIKEEGFIPTNISIQTWYSFLLANGVRPYQNFIYSKKRISSINFVQSRSTFKAKKTDIPRYYLTKSGDKIHTDKISEFICLINEKSKGKVINRLESIYDKVFIDEVQDLAGYDFEFLELLFKSNLEVLVVGDFRQATYFTNPSTKNRKFKGKNIHNLFKDWEKKGLCKINEKNECFRCNQDICNLADSLYPDMTKTISKNTEDVMHQGIYLIQKKDVMSYVEEHNPKILRDNKRTDTMGLEAINFGISKGQTFDNVLIFPNNPMKKFLKDKLPSKLADRTKANFYVALTRARSSVAIVCEAQSGIPDIEFWERHDPAEEIQLSLFGDAPTSD